MIGMLTMALNSKFCVNFIGVVGLVGILDLENFFDMIDFRTGT
jgi:hypothetical protein